MRGGAPGTREFDLLAPERARQRASTRSCSSGGSAFGLAACDGVVRWCEEHGIGFPTSAGPVPIVVGAVLFDLMQGDGRGAARRRRRLRGVRGGDRWRGGHRRGRGRAPAPRWPSGAGASTPGPAASGPRPRRDGDVIVAALVAVNAFGDLRPEHGDRPAALGIDPAAAFENTTIGVIATNATLDKLGCLLVAQSGHDGLARALEPVHATVDGDALVAAAVGIVDAPLDHVRILAARAVETADSREQ